MPNQSNLKFINRSLVPEVGFEPTYREDQYELFVEAGRFYRPVPLLRLAIITLIFIIAIIIILHNS